MNLPLFSAIAWEKDSLMALKALVAIETLDELNRDRHKIYVTSAASISNSNCAASARFNHGSSLLRVKDKKERHDAFVRFVADLAAANAAS